MKTMTLSEELTWRGFVNQTTYKEMRVLDTERVTFYLGVDPSAPSMTIGNLATVMMVRHFAAAGHKAILLVGGATGLIGDPDGKAEERTLLTLQQIATNKANIAKQYKQILGDIPFTPVDNYDWFKDVGYLEFLRDIGKHVPMSQMLGREFVQTRLGEHGSGISYAEFSYALIQGYDFLHLFRQHNCTLQLCGSDQWGNSVAGIELVRRIEGAEVNIWSAPLVINKATGVKFGKSEAGAVWLDPELTSPYQFYQFWLNVDDEGVEDYLKIYTLKNQQEIADIMNEFTADPSKRYAQKVLAYEVTALVHGTDRAESVMRMTEVLFGNKDYALLSEDDYHDLGKELGTVSAETTDLVQLVVLAGLATSKAEARRFIAAGAIYVNGLQVSPTTLTIDIESNHGYVVLRRGKNNQKIIYFA